MQSVPLDSAAASFSPRLLDLDADGEAEIVVQLMDPPDPSERVQHQSMWDKVATYNEL
jgi:hypothetical protein